MSFSYIFISKLKEISQNKRMAIIIVICLVLGYAFILVFSSKLYEINRRMSLTELKHVENAYISLYFDDFKIFSNTEVESGIVHRTDYKNTTIYFTFKDETYKTFAVEADKELSYHYKIEGFSDDFFDDNSSENRIMVSEYLANKYHMSTGDKLIIDDSAWTIYSIVSCEYFRNMIIFPENSGIRHQDGYSSTGTIIQFTETLLKNRPDILEILEGTKFASLQQRQQLYFEGLRAYTVFIILFALLFIVLSILNCYLVFFANISYKRKMFGIKKTYGASPSICFGDILLENTIFSLLAFHIACFLVQSLRHNIPTFFYTEITFPIYGIAIVAVFIITFLYSMLIFIKINRHSTIKLLKE